MHSPIVITSMGMVSPLGVGVQAAWQSLLGGRSGGRLIDSFDTANEPIKIAGLGMVGVHKRRLY